MQETKIKNGRDQNIRDYRLICLKTTQKDYGNGFLVHKKLESSIHKVWSVDNRISVIQIKTKPRYISSHNGKAKITIRKQEQRYESHLTGTKLRITKSQEKYLLTIINVYAPHSEVTRNNPEITNEFYNKLNNIVDDVKNTSSILMVAGDFNGEIGKKSDIDECLGRFTTGVRNVNGQYLINFCTNQELTVTNTCFQHKIKRLVTWEQKRVVQNKIQNLSKTLDYICIQTKYKHLLENSRSYHGTITTSDHKLLITKLRTSWFEVYRKVNSTKHNNNRKYNIQILINDQNKQKEFREQLDKNIDKEESKKWNNITSAIQKTAEKVLGFTKREAKSKMYSPVVEKLSNEQKEYRMKIEQTKDIQTLKELKNKRNKIMKMIKKEVKAQNEKKIDEIANSIQNENQSTAMFKAIKYLRNPHNKNKNTIIYNAENQKVINKNDQYNIVKEHFTQHFWNDQHEMVNRFEGPPRPLNKPISKEEVEKALNRMKNNKAPGEDHIPAELLKHSSEAVKQKISEIFNEILRTHQEDINIGKSNLIPIQKQGKEEGPVKNLRPINLLNTIRKLFSLTTLNRIQPKVDQYLSQSQSAYRPNRSTGDIIWAHRFLTAKAQLYQYLEIHIIGIDMSSAFDTINRNELMTELKTFLDEDECRMSRLLLSNTSINVQFADSPPEDISTNVGSPQGDAISGTFFNIAF